MSNKAILQKADMAVADLTANGGLLNSEQSDSFIRKLLTPVSMLQNVRRVVMNSPEAKVNKIQFANRIMRPAPAAQTVGNYLDASDRSKPTTSQITLNSKEVIAEVHLPYDVIEDNIERGNIGLHRETSGTDSSGGIKDTIMTLIAERALLDIEELALLGDTASGDAWLALEDGWLKRMNANITDAAGAPISRQLLTQGMKDLPVAYRRNRARLAHYTSTENEIDYRETIAQRETATGDSMTSSTVPVFGAGAPVRGVGLMPSTTGLLTDPQNLLFGIQRQIQVETDKDIRARAMIIVLTARLAFQVEEVEAGVKYTNFG